MFPRQFLLKLVQLIKNLVIWLRVVLEEAKLVLRDDVCFYQTGLTFILKVPSILQAAPFTVHRNSDGIRVLKLRRKYRLYVCYCMNIIAAIRLLLLGSICLHTDFRWIQNGLFTADTCMFGMWGSIALISALLFILLQYFKEDFVFLCNAVAKLNCTFSGK